MDTERKKAKRRTERRVRRMLGKLFMWSGIGVAALLAFPVAVLIFLISLIWSCAEKAGAWGERK